MGGSVGSFFTGKPSSGQEMPWTGVTPEQKAEDLRNWGYSEDQIRGLTSKAKPSLGQRFAQGTARGLAGGVGAGLEEEARTRQQGGGAAPHFPQPESVNWAALNRTLEEEDQSMARTQKGVNDGARRRRSFYGQ